MHSPDETGSTDSPSQNGSEPLANLAPPNSFELGREPASREPLNGSESDQLTATATTETLPGEEGLPGAEEWEEVVESVEGEATDVESTGSGVTRVRRRKRQPKLDSLELRLRGRRALCKRIADIAPHMLKLVKQRILNTYLQSKRGLEDEDLTQVILDDAVKLADRSRILASINNPDPDFNRGQLKAIIFAVLLQEETHSIPEHRLDEKVIEFEKVLVKQSKALDLTELRKHDLDRWHHLDTYRVVLEAAWSNDGVISPDEARLLTVLRTHLNITLEEHWLIGALLKRFPKEKNALHNPDEVNETRKDLQKQGLLWNYKDDDDQNIDVIPAEIATVIRQEYAGLELQTVNYRRLMSHDSILLTELRAVLQKHGLDRSGNKVELIERVVASDIKPSEVLGDLDKDKLSSMCSFFGLKASGSKAELIDRLITFYDDLTFEERATKDEREVWYSNYELLASRAHAELRAKKIITKDLEIEHLFERATSFLFDALLNVPYDMTRKDSRADGRLLLENDQCLLVDCKSAEGAVNLQDYLDGQFDGYLRKERETGKHPIGFLVIAPAFTPHSIRLANQYKARTNWDIALVIAEGLKHLADRWAATESTKPFPIRLLNRTDVIDKERAEFLLSLA